MITRSRIIQGASGLAGNPPNEPLPTGIPEWLRFETAADLETEMMRDINLSAENRSLSNYPVHLQEGQREFTISQSGLENPCYVSLKLTDEADLVPIDIEITNLSTVNGSARDGRRAVAFYSDKPQRGMLSWSPGGNEQLVIWYDRSPVTDPSADQATFTITDSYIPLLKLLLAAQMMEMLGKEIGKMLQARIARGMKQWEKFVRNGRQQGVVQKAAWRPGRYGRQSSQWDAWPGRVPIE